MSSSVPTSPSLSDYDQALGMAMPPFFRMFCFSYVPDVELLAFSLSRAIERFPRFSTRLVSTTSGMSKLVPLPEPLALEVRPPVPWWRPEHFSVDQVPAFVSGADWLTGQPVFSATLRQVGSGCVLSVSLSHAAGDFYSLFLFMSYWSEQYKCALGTGLRAGSYAAPSFSSPESADVSPPPEVLRGSPACAEKRDDTFINFERAFLDALRAELTTADVCPSLNEALTAFVVHRYGRQIMGRASGLRLRVPVNVRGVHPAVPLDFIGNAILEAIVPLDELVDSPAAARDTAHRLHRAVQKVRNREYVEAALHVGGDYVQLRERGLPVYNRQTDILSTNFSRMNFHTLDFGNGPPVQFFGTHSVYRGLAISYAPNGLDVRVFGDHGGTTAGLAKSP